MGSGSSKKVEQHAFKGPGPKLSYSRITAMYNGLLYRGYDDTEGQWWFYNDSKDMIIHVGILFDYDSRVKPLGKTTGFRIDDPEEGNEDDYGKYLCEVDVHPGMTEPFVMGTITGWRVDTLEGRFEEDETVFRL